MADDTADYDFGEFADPSDETVAERSPLERAQRAVGWLELRLGITRELFQLSLSWLGEEALLTEALGVVESYTRTEASSAIMLDRFHNDLYFAAATGPVGPDIKRYRMDRGEGIAGWCMEMGRVVRLNNIAKQPRWHAELSDALGFEVRQLMAAPILVRSRVIGCLELINKLDPGARFEPEDEQLLLEAAECVGLLFSLRARRDGA